MQINQGKVNKAREEEGREKTAGRYGKRGKAFKNATTTQVREDVGSSTRVSKNVGRRCALKGALELCTYHIHM
jgi:hypothetical protein